MATTEAKSPAAELAELREQVKTLMAAKAAEAPPPLSADLVELCGLVASRDRVPVGELITSGKDHTLLARALSKGLLQIGRQSYSETVVSAEPVTVAGKQQFDPDTRRAVMRKVIKVNLENDWSWTGLPPGRKSLRDLLDEEATLGPDVPKLHVRVTTEGMAAAP